MITSRPAEKMKTLSAFVFASLVCLALACAAVREKNKAVPSPAPASPRSESAEELFAAGRAAFVKGEDEKAARLLIAAVRADPRCLAAIESRKQGMILPSQPCASFTPSALLTKEAEDPAPRALYWLGRIKKNLVKYQQGNLATRKAGHYFFKRLVMDFPQTRWAAAASLILIQDGRCLDDGGYPDCPALLINAYEDWLEQYPHSGFRPEVLKKTAETYETLGDMFDAPRPWYSPVRSELCRGRAVQLAEEIIEDYPLSREAGWARKFLNSLKSSGKPYSIVPPAALLERKKKQGRKQTAFPEG